MLTPKQAWALADDLLRDDRRDADAAAPPEPIPDEPLPARIGNCRIIRRIAAGGMGTVYEAVQDQPHRTVAVKVLRRSLVSRPMLRRFQYEAEVLGRLQHPGIAQIYEAGTHDDGGGGVPYFVMEYVSSARSLTDFAAAVALDLRQRLELFTLVCDAVHYGHQRGIIHRDLKPANILVPSHPSPSGRGAGGQGGFPSPSGRGQGEGRPPSPTSGGGRGAGGEGESSSQPAATDASGNALVSPVALTPALSQREREPFQPKIIDFGIARATDADIAMTTMHTDVGELIGTLAYMSPEQCDGDPDAIDTRSDVYSLGIVLYELLCGRLPYEIARTSITRAARVIQEQAPARPEVAGRALKRDLEAVLLKAIAKDRRRRYQSAAELAADVRRHLQGQPVEARPPTRWIRTVQWLGRHPAWTTAGLCAAMVFATVSSTWFYVWLRYQVPYEVVRMSDDSAAELRSSGGAALAVWDTGVQGGIATAAFRRDLQGSEPSSAAVIGFSNAVVGEQRGALCVFDPAVDSEIPLWAFRVTPADLPQFAIDDGRQADQFQPGWCKFHDVFDGDGGRPELILQHHTQSANRVQIIDTSTGEILQEFWHQGGLSECIWLADSKLLVFAGLNQECRWDRRGGTLSDGFPLIAFGIRPTRHDRMLVDRRNGSPTNHPVIAWYHCVLPANAGADFMMPDFGDTVADDPARGHFRLRLRMQSDRNDSFSLLVDDKGHRVPTPRDRTDGYVQEGPVPYEDDIRLDDLPPAESE